VCNFLRKLFAGKRSKALRESQSALTDDDSQTGIADDRLRKTRFKLGSCQSTGRERAHNEDTIFTLSAILEGLDQPIQFGIFLVADGMGGHQSGEVASNLASKAVSQTLISRLYDEFLFEGESFSDESVCELIKSAIDEAQKLISTRVPGGGTTLTLVLALGERLFYGHVGDSRLYTINGEGNMHLLTRDHSLTKRLIDLGEITEKEARTHPQRNVLYRALGQTDHFEPDIHPFDLEGANRFMLCSDGLWGTITEQDMANVIRSGSNIDDIASDLVREANQAGGPDNISVVLVEKLG